MPTDFTRRVIPAVLTHQVHTRNVEVAHTRRISGLQMSRHVQKPTIDVARHTPRELLGIPPERLS
ncbi:MAG: hypothetical protein ACK55I_34720, partial [bacterium]